MHTQTFSSPEEIRTPVGESKARYVLEDTATLELSFATDGISQITKTVEHKTCPSALLPNRLPDFVNLQMSQISYYTVEWSRENLDYISNRNWKFHKRKKAQ